MKVKNKIPKTLPADINKSTEGFTNLIYQGILCFIFFVIYMYIFDRKPDLNGDNFDYINYATSILKGKGYSSPYTPDYVPTNWFPPGYSTILALVMFFTGKNIIIFNCVNGVFFLGTILLFNNLMRRITNNAIFSFSISLLILLNSGLLRLATIVMSEIPYLFFSVLAFYYVIRLKDDIKFWRSKYFYAIIVAATIAYYLRSTAIVLIGAIVLYFLFEKKWKISVGFLMGFLALYLPWIIRNSIHGLKGRYLGTIMTVNPWRPEEGQISSVSEFVDKMVTNFYDTVIRGFTEVAFPFIQLDGMAKSLLMALGLTMLVICLFGAWKLNHYKYFFISYILGNIVILLIWHGGNGSRYVWPLAPFISYCFFYGLYQLLNRRFEVKRKKMPKMASYAFLLLSFFFIPKLKAMHKEAKQSSLPPPYKNYAELAKSVKKMSNTDLKIACRKPGMFYYYSNTYVTNYLYSLDDKEVLKDLITKHIDFVVLEQLGYSSTGRYLYPAIEKNSDLFQVTIHLKNPDTYLLHFDIEKAKKKLNIQ